MIMNIEEGFCRLLQSDVILSIGEKQFKKGKFLNFKVKDFHIELDLIINGKYRQIDIPMPFGVDYADNTMILSYQIKDMGSYGDEIIRMIQNSIGGGKSKLYNKILKIGRVNNEE